VDRLKNLPEGSEQPLIKEIKSWFVLPGISSETVASTAKLDIGRMPNE
jgi:hypothetical protein